MDYAYFIENTDNEYLDNTGVFTIINDLEIEEDEVYIDNKNSKGELEKLIDILKAGDRIVIRSVMDLSDDAKDLLDCLSMLQDKEITLCSINENYLNGADYYTAMRGFVDINRYYLNRRREKGFERAKQEGTVGRPRMTEEIKKAIRLYNTKAFTTAEIEKLSGVSSSTLYRALKDNDKQ